VSSRAVVFSVILFGLALVCLVVACGGGGEVPPIPPTVQMTPGGGESPGAPTGDELLQARCTVCHDLGRVEAASNTLDEWEHEVEHMRQLGAQLTDAEAQTLVEFLAKTYGP
jgi:cytochrome c5